MAADAGSMNTHAQQVNVKSAPTASTPIVRAGVAVVGSLVVAAAAVWVKWHSAASVDTPSPDWCLPSASWNKVVR